MTFLARLARWLDPDFEPACRFDASMAQLVDEFRNDRAKEMADLIESRSERGAQLSACQVEMQQWRQYAQSLERICLGAGLSLPPGPDE